MATRDAVVRNKTQLALKHLSAQGLLLMSDARLPSVVSLCAGGPVQGSWWNSESAHIIYEVGNTVAGRSDVLTVKLISGKVTYVHKRLWQHIYAMGTGREKWQTAGLTNTARSVLRKLERHGILQTDWLIEVGGYESKGLSRAVDLLESRLLVYAEQFHTEQGKHAKRIETWKRWAERTGFTPNPLQAKIATYEIQNIVDGLNRDFHGEGKLPWQ